MKEVRISMGEAQVQASSRSIQAQLLNLEAVRQAKILLVYVSIGKEVQTWGLLRSLLQQDKRVAVPQVVNRQVTAYEIKANCKWETGSFRLPVPQSSSLLSTAVDVCIVPGLAFSLQCDRLGFGYGHWDRFFGRTSVQTVIGVCHDRQILSSIPVESTDRAADLVVTEKRVLFREDSAALLV